MRDPNRIFPLCTRIAQLWHDTCPDIRFMQLMSDFTSWLGRDPFYMEDDAFAVWFREFIDEIDYKHAPPVIHKTPDGTSYM